MYERTTDQKNNYFRELTHNLHREGFEVDTEEDDLLPVKLDGQRLCQATRSGGIRYWREDTTDERMSKALERVTDIAGITDEYMRQMDTALFLRVGSQEDRYRLLADFNGTVLAGCQTEYGAQFVTWERSPDRSSLNHGHYYGPDRGAGGYIAAKQDFAVRSELVSRNALFTSEEMAEIYRCVQDSLENNGSLTVDQESTLHDVCGKIQQCVLNVDELTDQESGQEMEQSF